MNSIIFALESFFSEMETGPDTFVIKNKEHILASIQTKYNLDAEKFKKITISQKFPAFAQFGIAEIPFHEVLSPLLEDDTLKLIQENHFPQLSVDTIWNVIFGIYWIIDSCRLELSQDQKRESWYFKHSSNPLYMSSRLYFYEALQDYAANPCYANLFYRYLCATSSSPCGGLLSIASFYIDKKDTTYDIIIPNTQFSYRYFLQVIANSTDCQQSILVNFAPSISIEEVKSAFWLLQKYWDCFSITSNSTKENPHIRILSTNRISRKAIFKKQQWLENPNVNIYEDCHFYQVDFSHQVLSSDFICCTFEECNFFSTTLFDIYVQGLFPILHCRFIGCTNIPKDYSFQATIKSCVFL